MVLDVPRPLGPLGVGGAMFIGALDELDDDPKLANPVLLIRASARVGAWGWEDSPRPSKASFPIRL